MRSKKGVSDGCFVDGATCPSSTLPPPSSLARRHIRGRPTTITETKWCWFGSAARRSECASQSHRHDDVRVALIRLRPDDARANVIAEPDLHGRIVTGRNYAQRVLHVCGIEPDREFFALEIDVKRLACFACFRTRR